jgi:hypothetical protein
MGQRRADRMVWLAVLIAAAIMLFAFLHEPF